MRLELGTPVRCSDGPVGELGDVVVDAAQRRVTHLVVEPHHRHHSARLVPATLLVEERTATSILLRCTARQLRALPRVAEVAYLPLGELPLTDPDWDVGIESVISYPDVDYAGVVSAPFNVDPHLIVAYDRIPKGEVEVRHGSGVLSVDRHAVGHVDGLLVDADDHITHVLVRRGHVFRWRQLPIPIADVLRMTTDEVQLSMSKDEVGRSATATAARRPRRHHEWWWPGQRR